MSSGSNFVHISNKSRQAYCIIKGRIWNTYLLFYAHLTREAFQSCTPSEIFERDV